MIMDSSNIILTILIIICVVFFLSRRKPETANKSSAVKKEEIIVQYKEELKVLLENCSNDSLKLKEEKIRFIKNANQELNKNIFLNENEVKKIIYELTLM